MDIEKDSNREAFEAFFYENCMFQWEQDLSEMFFQVLENNEYDYARVQSSWLSWQAAKAQAVLECTWVKNEDGYFDASCGQSFVFSEPEDKPSSHEFTHCCFCGGKLIELQEPAND